jgi:NADPH-dependent curcumin reductase CurA
MKSLTKRLCGDIDMTLSIARQIVLAARPQGTPRLTDFRLEETAIPTPASGQLLLGVQYLSLDPYMRGRMDDRKSYAKPLQLGEVMTGETVAQVLTSNHPAYAAGDIVLAPTGWRTHALSDGTACASLILSWRRSRPASACSACQGSRRMPVCG